MRRWRWFFVAAFLILAMIVVSWIGKAGGSGPSVLSPAGSGWLAAQRYLQARGRETLVSDRPFSSSLHGTITTAFPWEGSLDTLEEQVRERVSRGGDLVLAYSGNRVGIAEERLLELFGIESRDVRGDLPFDPRAWYRYRTQVWSLRRHAPPRFAAGAIREAAESDAVVCLAPRRVPQAPRGALALFDAPDGSPAIFLVRYGRGRVLVLPADAWSNARLSHPGNADLLESAGRMLTGPILFDEYHHGLSERTETAGGSAVAFDLLIGQLLLIYSLAVLALARRLGPAWREAPTRSGTTSSFLIGLAARHRALRHFPAAARLLLSRVGRLDPSLPVAPDLLLAAESAGEETFLRLAVAVARSGRKETVS